MCFDINKYGQMVDVGLTGQYDYRLTQHQPNMPTIFPFKTNSQQRYQTSFPGINKNQFSPIKTPLYDMIEKSFWQIKNPDVLLPSQKTGWGGIYE
jgi:hypothetical protein